MNKEEILNVITRNVCEVIPALEEHKFQPEDSLKELGANSIDRSEIVMMTLESLSLRVALIELAGAENIGDLAGILYEKQ